MPSTRNTPTQRDLMHFSIRHSNLEFHPPFSPFLASSPSPCRGTSPIKVEDEDEGDIWLDSLDFPDFISDISDISSTTPEYGSTTMEQKHTYDDRESRLSKREQQLAHERQRFEDEKHCFKQREKRRDVIHQFTMRRGGRLDEKQARLMEKEKELAEREAMMRKKERDMERTMDLLCKKKGLFDSLDEYLKFQETKMGRDK